MVLVRLVICLDLGQIGNDVISLWGCLWVSLGCRMFSRIVLGLGFIIVSCTSSVIRIYSISIFSHRLYHNTGSYNCHSHDTQSSRYALQPRGQHQHEKVYNAHYKV